MNETGFNWSGLFQSVASTATGYLDKRLDIEMQTKLARLQEPQITNKQAPVNQAGTLFGMSPTALTMIGVGLVAVLLLARR